MGFGYGSSIVKDGLVLAYDNGGGQSWKGMPTTNVLNTNGISTQSTSVNVSDLPNLKEISNLVGGEDNITHPVHQMADSNWVDLHMMSGTVSVPAGDYFIFSIYIFTNNPTNRFNFNGNFGSTLGTNAGFGGPVNIETNKWYRAVGYKQNTTGSAITVQYPRLETYSTSVWGGGDIDAWACCPQVEVKSGSSFASPFTPTSRSTTTSLLDWTGNNTITLNSLTYNSDNTFDLTGSNGSNVSIPNIDLRTDFTLECWAKLDGVQGGFFGHGITSNQQGLHITCQSGKTRFGMYGNDTDFSTTHSTGVWTHYMFTYNHSTYVKQMYKNGVSLSGSTVQTQTPYTASSNTLRVGQNYSSYNASGIDGKLPVARMYNRVLSAAEVAQNYNALRGRFGV